MDSFSNLLSGSLQQLYSGESTAHAAPRGGQQRPAPTPKDLVQFYDSLSGRTHVDGYEDIDRPVQNETWNQEGTWGLSVTNTMADATKRIETSAAIELNRSKQTEAPFGWELSSTFMTQSGHFIGSADQDGVTVRIFTGIGPFQYQGNLVYSWGGDEDSTVHTISCTPKPYLNLGYKYQGHSQGSQQTFSAATKIDTINLGLETMFAQGNTVLSGKIAKKWFLFTAPKVKRGDDVTEEIQRAERQVTRSMMLTAMSLNSMMDMTFSFMTKFGAWWFRDFALLARVSTSQGKVDVKGATSFIALQRRVKMCVDSEGSFAFGTKFGVWGDSCLDVESKLEFNPIQLFQAAQLPVFSAKLNWNVPHAQDLI